MFRIRRNRENQTKQAQPKGVPSLVVYASTNGGFVGPADGFQAGQRGKDKNHSRSVKVEA
jgi:hypothetical protein